MRMKPVKAWNLFIPILGLLGLTGLLGLALGRITNSSVGLLTVIAGFIAIIIFLFISRQKQENKLLYLSEKLAIEKFRASRILESAGESILITNKAGNTLFINTKMMVNFNLESFKDLSLEAICKHIQSQMDSTNALEESVDRYMEEGSSNNLTFQFKYKSSKEEDFQFYELNATTVQSEGIEKEPSHLFVFRNRTGEEKVLQMKSELISIVSHELRTPLSSIIGFAEILLYRKVTAEKQARYFQTIYDESIRLAGLINDFLDLERMEAGQQKYHITPVSLDHLMLEIVEQWTEKQFRNIALELESNAITVLADENRLRQVINHLINNALKYSSEADRVEIRLGLREGKATISIQDYGLGIPEESKSQLFTKFYRVDNSDRRQTGGTGLGLSICKEIVEKLGGQLSFISDLGVGSIFTVELTEYEIVDLDQKIVVVRNNDTIAQFIFNNLDILNMPFVHLDTAEACILALNKCTPAKRPSMMLLDLNLQGLNAGWSVLDKIHEVSGMMEIPVIIFRSLDSFGVSNEFEIIAKVIKTIDSQAIASSISYMLNKEHQHTFLFSERDESIVVSSLIHRGMEIKKVTAKPSYTEIELVSKPFSNEI
jgi:signal transduction histidine kinase